MLHFEIGKPVKISTFNQFVIYNLDQSKLKESEEYFLETVRYWFDFNLEFTNLSLR